MNNVVQLEPEDIQLAMEQGRRRNDEAIARKYKQTDGSNASNALRNHQRGVASEIAVAKFLEMGYWSPTFNGYRGVPDLPGLEVRSTTPSRPYLRIKKTDANEKKSRIFVLVTRLGEGAFRIEGYVEGRCGMRDEYFLESDPDSKKPEWHVPTGVLCSPDELYERINTF